jgi:hypothetical protein
VAGVRVGCVTLIAETMTGRDFMTAHALDGEQLAPCSTASGGGRTGPQAPDERRAALVGATVVSGVPMGRRRRRRPRRLSARANAPTRFRQGGGARAPRARALI